MNEAQVQHSRPQPETPKYYEPLLAEGLSHIVNAEVTSSEKDKLISLLTGSSTAANERLTGLKKINEDKYLSDLAKKERTQAINQAFQEQQTKNLEKFEEAITQLESKAEESYKANLPKLNYEALAFAREDARMLLDGIDKDLKLSEAIQELMQGGDKDMRDLLLFTPFTDRYLTARNKAGIKPLLSDAINAIAPKYLNEKASAALQTKQELKKLKQAQMLFNHALRMMAE